MQRVQKVENTNNNNISDDPYMNFINDCFNKFEENKTDKISLDTIPQILDMLDMTGNKRETMMNAFSDMCKFTESEIYRYQYVSVLLHTKGKDFCEQKKTNEKPLPPTPPRVSQSQNKNEKKDTKQIMPTISELLKNKDSIHAWAMKKGDTFFKTNKKRLIILSENIFYWCASETDQYSNAGLNLCSKHVSITQHSTLLRIKSSQKERIFNCGDIETAKKFYKKMKKVKKKELKQK